MYPWIWVTTLERDRRCDSYIVLIAKENICVLGPTYTLTQCPVEVSIQKLENGTQKMVPLPQGHLALMGHPKSLHKNPSTLTNPHWLKNHEKPRSFCRGEWVSFPLETVANLWSPAFWRSYLSGSPHPESPVNHLFPSVIKAITASGPDSLRQQSWLVKANVTL